MFLFYISYEYKLIDRGYRSYSIICKVKAPKLKPSKFLILVVILIDKLILGFLAHLDLVMYANVKWVKRNKE